MSLRLYLSYMARESRGSRGRLAFFVACLAVGVAAVVAVAGLAGSLDQTIRSEARQLMAADLVVEGQRPIPPELDAALATVPGSRRTDVKELVTVVAAPGHAGEPGHSQLVELKAIAGEYPFYGTLRLEPDRPLAELLDAASAVVGPDLLTRLHLAVGDRLRIGGQDYRIAAQVLSEPDRIGGSFSLGPRVFVSIAGLDRAELEGRGSRVFHRALIKLPEAMAVSSLKAFAEEIKRRLPADQGFDVQTYAEGQPSLRRGLSRVERFLGLVALLSLLIGGIGVAQTVRAWIAGRMDAIAVLKCLGLRPREIFSLYLGQTALLGVAGSLAGAAAGILVQLGLPSLLGDLLPAHLVHPFQPLAILRGLGLGVGVALLFSLAPLAGVLRVPPSRVLRRDAEPLPGSRWARWVTGLALLAGIFAMAAAQAGSLDLGARFTAGIVVATLVLSGAALGVTRLVGRLPREGAGGKSRVWLRHGLAALARPGAATLGAIVALGLGVLVVLGMSLVQGRLAERLEEDLPKDAPTAFLIDIQPEQWAGVDRLLAREGATRVESVPVVMARLTAIDGHGAEELAGSTEREHGRRRWALTREQRLTYMRELPADNTVVAGALWSDPARPEVSVEQELAEDLGVHVGSTLAFDVQGVPLELEVTSLRTVAWETFGINFFLVVEPGVLDDAPQQRLAAVRLPPGREQAIQDEIAAEFPNVTMLRIRDILEKVAAVLKKVALGVRFLGGFTVLAGIAILAGAVSAGSARRGREVALLKTLGMTRRGVIAVFSLEYALIGLIAGAIGAAGGGVLAWTVLTRQMEIPWQTHPLPFLAAVAGAGALTVAAGIAASAGALAKRPIEVLRSE